MKGVIKLIRYTMLLPLHWLSYLFVKDKNLWVFGSWFGMRYSDNSKYVFEYVLENNSEINAVWLSNKRDIVTMLRGKGRKAYLINSLMGYIICARANVYFFSSGLADLNRYSINRGLRFQLWHGVPLKKIGYDDSKTPYKSLKTRTSQMIFPFNKEIENWSIINSSGHYVTQLYKSAFNKKDDNIVVTGFPRSDIILGPQDSELINRISEQFSGCKFVAYVPTFRIDEERSLEVFNDEFYKINNILESLNLILLVKMHFVHSEVPITMLSFPRIIFMTENDCDDINYLLPHIDVLITDYSSVYYDYLLLDRPIIFTPFDIDIYISKDRELYEDYDEVTPGPKCADWNKVDGVLREIFVDNKDYYQCERQNLREKIYDFIDQNNSKRVVEAVKDLTK